MITRQADFSTALTAGFLTNLAAKDAQLRLQFKFDGTGYDNYVYSVGNISRSNDLNIGQLVVTVTNTDGQWNALLDTEGELSKIGALNLYHEGGSEYMPLFYGQVVSAVGHEGEDLVDLLIRDRLATLLDGPMGDADDVKDYTDTGRTPAELIWKIVDEEAGFDTTTGQSNTDIDWGMYGDFQAYTSAQNLSLKAYFYGNSIRSAIREILRISSGMAWTTNEGKLGLTHAYVDEVSGDHTWTEEHIIDLVPVPDIENVINYQKLKYGYVRDGKPSWGGFTTHNDSPSQALYGVQKHIEQSVLVWHDDLASAQGGRDWVDALWDGKRVECRITVPWLGFTAQIGDPVDVTYSKYGFSNDIFKILDIVDINLDEYTITVKALLKP